MDTPPQPSNPALDLARDTYYQLVHTLRGSLLPPVTDTPEDLARRDNAAIAHEAWLLPVDADEANLAVQNVAAMDCLRIAREYATSDHAFFLKFNARAISMMRQARGEGASAACAGRAPDHTAADRASWIEHCAIGLMTDALGTARAAALIPCAKVSHNGQRDADETPQR
jgi:hypothetical protein